MVRQEVDGIMRKRKPKLTQTTCDRCVPDFVSPESFTCSLIRVRERKKPLATLCLPPTRRQVARKQQFLARTYPRKTSRVFAFRRRNSSLYVVLCASSEFKLLSSSLTQLAPFCEFLGASSLQIPFYKLVGARVLLNVLHKVSEQIAFFKN